MEGINDPRELLVCARYEFFRGEPVETAYKNFCEIVGNDAMAYRDFEFWWYRFKEGNFDLDYDRIKNPSKELGDMPIDIMEEIFENLEWKDRVICRKVSGKIRNVIDNMKLIMTGIGVFSFDNTIQLVSITKSPLNNKISIEYEKTNSGCLIKWDKKSKIINGADSRQMAYSDLKIILNNPKLRLGTFNVDMDVNLKNRDAFFSSISACLSSLNHQLNVKCVRLYAKNQEEVLAVLPYLKPRVLEEIQFSYTPTAADRATRLKIDKVFDLDQWKQAKYFNSLMLILGFKLEHFLHFNKIDARIDAISKEDVIRVKNTILASPHFKFCYLTVESNESFEDVIEIFGEEKISIPGSTSFIDVRCNDLLNFVSLRKRS